MYGFEVCLRLVVPVFRPVLVLICQCIAVVGQVVNNVPGLVEEVVEFHMLEVVFFGKINFVKIDVVCFFGVEFDIFK
jgi:hypothetical protein